MLKLFTGNINEALQSIKPDVYLNIADVRGTGVHPLSNVLFRDYPEYNEMLSSLKYSDVDRRLLPGRFMYRNSGNVTHVLGFIDFTQISTTDGVLFNMPLIRVLQALSENMMQGKQRSIVIPYYGLRSSGYHFLDFLDMLDMVFNPEITVYISVSEQYTSRTELECLRFNSPIPDNGKRTIYQTKEVQRPSAFEALRGYSPDKERRMNYKPDQKVINQFFGQHRFANS